MSQTVEKKDSGLGVFYRQVEHFAKSLRFDGWANVLTGLGRKSKDKRMSASVTWTPLTEGDAEELYAQDDIAAKIVDILPQDALREGFEIEGLQPEQNKRLEQRQKDLKALKAFEKAWIWARLYGGAALLKVTRNLSDLEKPFQPGEQIVGLTVLHRYELLPDWGTIQKDIRKQNFAEPELYSFQPRQAEGAQGVRIHRSRLIRFAGVPLPTRQRIKNQYWEDSVLTRLYNPIRNYQTAHDSAAALVQDIRIGVFKIRNLADMIASGADVDVIKRLEIVSLSKSICNAVAIDAEGEDFEHKMGSVTGIKDLLDKVDKRLVAGTRMPHTVLLGESPEGSQATGNSTTLQWYDYVAQQQRGYLEPLLMELLEALCFEEKLPFEKLKIVFNPLWQLDEKEQADVREKQANADAAYIDRGVLDPREVAVSRFGSGRYSTETTLEGSLFTERPEPPKEEPTEEPEPKPKEEK